MPRLPNSLIRRARHIHPLLPLLLRPCRDLESARNELRWLWEHSVKINKPQPNGRIKRPPSFAQLCRQRATGKPLQYILGDQPFGELTVQCRPGVLIPRPETEQWVTHLAQRLINNKPAITAERGRSVMGKVYGKDRLRIMDLCSGTGCITLLLADLLSHDFIYNIQGYDIEPRAIDLAFKNLDYNRAQIWMRPSSQVWFREADVLSYVAPAHWKAEIIVANPPYISPAAFRTETSRSVRKFEPHLALVPGDGPDTHGHLFTRAIARIADQVGAKVLIIEGDGSSPLIEEIMQGTLDTGVEGGPKKWDHWEVWRDELRDLDGKGPREEEVGGKVPYTVIGSGHRRTNVLIRGSGCGWMARGAKRNLLK